MCCAYKQFEKSWPEKKKEKFKACMYWMWRVTINSTNAPLSNPLNSISGLVEFGPIKKEGEKKALPGLHYSLKGS